MMRNPLILLGTLVVAGVLGYGLIKRAGTEPATTPPRQIIAYQDSMHPWVKLDRPGKCTICAMELTPIFAGANEVANGDNLVVLSSNNITVLNVQTEAVKRQSLQFTFRVTGTLDADENRKAIFSAPAPGRIHEMVVGAVGDEVEAAQPLLTFYSPELSTWRRAYVVRGRTSTAATPLFAGRVHEDAGHNARPAPGGNAKSEMAAAPMPSSTEPDPYFSDLLSPLSGTIIERKVFNGQYVMEGDRLLTIVDTSVLWFRFDAYERQLPWLRAGQAVRLKVAALPGQEFNGVISVIEPALDETTRTVKVRANIANPSIGTAGTKQRYLRLGMYADAAVQADLPNVLTVPRTSVFSPGGQTYTYVEEGAGAYRLRPVKLGRQGDELCEVLEGLKEGDRVVTTGNVLIDAQAQFINPRRSGAAAGAERPEPEVVMPIPSMKEAVTSAPPTNTSLPAAQTSTAPATKVTAVQTRVLSDFLTVATELSAALASDNLGDVRRIVPRLTGLTTPLVVEFGEAHPWHPTIQALSKLSKWPEVRNLAAARATFLPFSTRVVELVQLLQAAGESGALSVYHCPMAPKPGLWCQADGPLRNPFFGAEMLSCGELVPAVAPAMATAPRVEPPAPPPRTVPVDPIHLTNTRHPEAKERMLRTFALGVAEQHRSANKSKATPSPANEAGDMERSPTQPGSSEKRAVNP